MCCKDLITHDYRFCLKWENPTASEYTQMGKCIAYGKTNQCWKNCEEAEKCIAGGNRGDKCWDNSMGLGLTPVNSSGGIPPP